MEKKLGAQKRKLDPKLRMVTNGSEVVNILRAEQAAAVGVQNEALLAQVPRMRDLGSRPLPRKALPPSAQRGKLDEIPGSVEVNVFVELVHPSASLPPILEKVKTARNQNLVAACVPLDRLEELLEHTSVSAVELGERVTFAQPVAERGAPGVPAKALRRFGSLRAHGAGEGVIIGIIDVQGFDFAHPDFVDENGEARFLSIWDQGGDARPAAEPFGYGSEITREQMQAALRAAPKIHLPATTLEPQSQMVPSSHGTHVASIAAGNRGVCRRAEIVGVLISLPAEDQDRRRSFYDSTRIAHAVDYIFQKAHDRAQELQLSEPLPVSINISLGTNGHAHDASSAVSRWVDYGLATPGRSLCVAAGNAGQEAPQAVGDLGFMTGRVHTSGRLEAAGLFRNIEWVVLGDGRADLSENELELWYSPQDRFSIELKPPGGKDWIGPVAPGEFIENLELPDGTFVSLYNELYAPANGDNRISCFLSPFLSPQGVVGVKAGTWTVRLRGLEVREGSYHGWIERDDPRRLGRSGMVEAWSLPSFFAEGSFADHSTVSSLACGQRIVSVANLDETHERIHVTSSQGPTRDGRHKPEIAAPGTGIVAANGFSGPKNRWVAKTGTSMASPYVAGVIGLMLAVEPRLTAAQITGLIRRTAKPLPGKDFSWRDDSGFGCLDSEACIVEAARVNQRKDLKR